MAGIDFENPEVLLIALLSFMISLILFKMISSHKKPSKTLTNWPVLGMLPGLLKNIARINDFVTEILLVNGGTFEFKGGWFSNMDMVFTCDPADIQYIFSKNFQNYPKGPDFKKKFEVLGDGIFNADFELWELHRRTTVQFMSNPRFYAVLEKSVWEKVENELFRVLDSFSDQRVVFDLQDVVQRFTFDCVCRLVLDYDPGSLRVDLPYVASEKAFNDLIHGLLHRHPVPESIWKLQRWLEIGKEKRIIQAWKAVDEMIYPRIVDYQENPNQKDYVLLGSFRRAYEDYKIISGNNSDLTKFLRDTSLNLIFAGRDTTSSALAWLFWLVSKSQSVEGKIVQEIEAFLQLKNGDGKKYWRSFTVEDTKKLVYLHAVICETLRLFPSLPLELKAPVRSDVLPSGISVKENTKVVVSFYSTGRMKSLWGEDCLEFRPERWISEPDGRVRREPSYKFPAFNVGPRTCIGREMAFIQIKMVASAVIYRYKIEAVEGDNNKVLPKDSIILQMKHGLMVSLSKK